LNARTKSLPQLGVLQLITRMECYTAAGRLVLTLGGNTLQHGVISMT